MEARGQRSPKSVSARIADHLRSNVVGYLALLIALSGTAYAANKVTARQIARDAIRSRHIKDGQVNSADVADNSLTGSDIDEASLQIAQQPLQIGADSLGGTEIDESSLDPSVLQRRISGSCGANQTISAVDSSGGVTCHTDADSAPGPGSITSTEIADGTIADADISPSAAISSSKIAGQMGVYTGRIDGLLTTGPSLAFGSASGISSAGGSEASLTTLSPAASLTARGLSVKLSAAPGLGNFRSFELRLDGVDTSLTCAVFGNATTCNSGTASVSVPPGSELSMQVFSDGTPTGIGGTSAMFGWQVR